MANSDLIRRILTMPLLAIVVLGAACSDEASRATGTPTAESPVGAYAPPGAGAGVLLLEEDGSFCLSEEGFRVVGEYEVDGTTVELRPSTEALPDISATIDGDVITDPDGIAWTRTEDPEPCEGEEVEGSQTPSAGASDAMIGAIEEALLATDLPPTLDGARELANAMPARLAGMRTGGPVESAGGGLPVVVITYGADPAHPLAALEMVVLGLDGSLTPAQMVDATAHLGFGFDQETNTTGQGEVIPRVIGHVTTVEGVGELQPGEQGYLAVWAPTADAEVAYVLGARAPETLMVALEAISRIDRG